LLVPLLAVDREGNRLGYGGGYYDFTLLKFRLQRERPVIAVGLAYEAQITSNVPHDLSDAKLDWLITETHVIQFNS
jgi:5-formyltetrahydrofolate cyclo-ligase